MAELEVDALTQAFQQQAQIESRPQQADKAVGLVYDAVMLWHMKQGHDECPERLSLLHATLHQLGLAQRCATDAELKRAHTAAYVRQVDAFFRPGVTKCLEGSVQRELLEGAQGNVEEQEQEPEKVAPLDAQGDNLMINTNLFVGKHTALAARTAAGCAVEAVQAVLSRRVMRAFAAVRPPGHHAAKEACEGFCIFNNTAVAAQAARAKGGVERVLIFDWDIHHGDGTQAIFYDDPSVMTVGARRGKGFNGNLGWLGDRNRDDPHMGDSDYVAAYDLLLEPILTAFDPQLVIIGAGFDAADGDPMGGCHLTPAGYGHLAARLLRLAGGKVVAVLEGGYNTGQVAACSAEVVRVLLGGEPAPLEGADAGHSLALHPPLKKSLLATLAATTPFWPGLPTPDELERSLALRAQALRPQAAAAAQARAALATAQKAAGRAAAGAGAAAAKAVSNAVLAAARAAQAEVAVKEARAGIAAAEAAEVNARRAAAAAAGRAAAAGAGEGFSSAALAPPAAGVAPSGAAGSGRHGAGSPQVSAGSNASGSGGAAVTSSTDGSTAESVASGGPATPAPAGGAPWAPADSGSGSTGSSSSDKPARSRRGRSPGQQAAA